MNKKELVNELKKVDSAKASRILPILHHAFNFDFESDFSIYRFDGNFTHNKIKKLVGVSDFSEYNASMIITNIKYRENYFYIVGINENGFSLSFRNNVPFKYYSCFDWFNSGSTFESARKEQNIVSYVVIQKKELEKKPIKKEVDFSIDRIKAVSSVCLGSYNEPQKHGISSIDYVNPYTGEKNTLKIGSFESDNVNFFIDKSGYFLQNKRNVLKQNAKALKTKRLKQEVSEKDFSSDIRNIKNLFNALKSELSNRLNEHCDYEKLGIISSCVRSLEWITLDINRLEKANTEKTFSSVESAKYLISSIWEKLERTEEKMIF